jgi:hypothetical protein
MNTLLNWLRWFFGLFQSLWRIVIPGAAVTPDGPDHLLDTRRIIVVMQPIIIVGLLAVVYDCGTDFAQGLIFVGACLVCGFLTGFLFGIPKILQGARATSTDTNTASGYRQRVNTNLEEISDWLTKIIVGLGLYELKLIPGWIDRLAAAFASSLSQTKPHQAFLGAAIVFFLICGFLLGYLVTRLYLQGALGRADLAAVPDEGAQPKRSEETAVVRVDSAPREDTPEPPAVE